MGRFVQGEDRRQDYLLPASLDDYVSEDNPVRAIEVTCSPDCYRSEVESFHCLADG